MARQMEGNPIINFGRYKGTAFRNLPVSYMRWLRDNNIVIRGFDWSDYARRYMIDHNLGAYVSRDEIEELQEQERILAQEEAEEWQKNTLRWTASSGQEIEIRLSMGADDYGNPCSVYKISVGGRHTKTATEIIDLASSPVPGIVARVGNIGLTAERRDVLKWMED